MDKVGKAPGRNGFQQRRYFQGIDAGASRQTERGDGRIGAKTTGTIEDGNGRLCRCRPQVVLLHPHQGFQEMVALAFPQVLDAQFSHVEAEEMAAFRAVYLRPP